MTKKIKKEKFKPPVLTKAEVVTQEEMIKRYPLGGFDVGDPRTFFIGPTWESIWRLPIEVYYEFRLNDIVFQSCTLVPIESIITSREENRGYGMGKLEDYASDFQIPGFDLDWEWDKKGFVVLSMYKDKEK